MDRLVRPQWVYVRPLNADNASNGFGDASMLTSDLRTGAKIRVRMQVTILSGVIRAGQPGREKDARATALFRRKDIPAGESWEPTVNDVVEIAGFEPLFIVDVQPAFPRQPSVRFRDGGFAGWRLMLADATPVMSPANQYDQ